MKGVMRRVVCDSSFKETDGERKILLNLGGRNMAGCFYYSTKFLCEFCNLYCLFFVILLS